MVGVAALFLLVPLGYWRTQVRESDLLEHGEVAMGRVLSQWRDPKQGSSIQYEFTDFLGQVHRGMAFDRNDKLYPGMPVPVFYDRDNPERQIPYCATRHEVILPASLASDREELIAGR